MAASPSAALLLKALQFLAKLLTPIVRLERKRAGADEGFPHEFALLEPFLVEAIQLVVEGPPSLTSSPIQWLKFRVSDPPISLCTAISREWLAQHGVQELAKSAIRARFARIPSDGYERELADSLADVSGDRREISAGVVHDLLAFLALSINRHLSPSDGIAIAHQALIRDSVSDTVKAEMQETRRVLLKEVNIASLPDRNALVDQQVERQLSDILKRRFLPSYDLLSETRTLLEALDSGLLRGASAQVRGRVLDWHARAHVAVNQPKEARTFLDAARATNASGDLTLTEARILAAEGKVQEGLRLVRDRGDIEAATTTLVLLRQSTGAEASIKYYEGNPHFFSNPIESTLLILLQDYAELGLWDKCRELANSVSHSQLDRSVALTAAVGVELLAQAAPQEQRRLVLRNYLLNPSIVRFHDDAESRDAMARAHELLARAAQMATDLGVVDAARLYRFISSWAWIANPETASEARKVIANEMARPETAVPYVRLAVAYGIEFDAVAVRRYLADRRTIGGWSVSELEAALLCSLAKDTPEDVQSFITINRHELDQRFSPAMVRSLEINIAIKTGRTESAVELLGASGDLLTDEDRERLSMLLKEQGPQNIASLKSLYERTGALEDLSELIASLGQAKDWVALIPYAREMFTKTRLASDALVVCHALLSANDEDAVYDFLSSNDAVVSQAVELKRHYGWALARNGRLLEADQVLSSVPADQWDSNDRNLYIHISIESGDWERLGRFVELEWQNRSIRSATDLLRAAAVALEVDSGRVMDLLGAAVRAAPEDADILVTAYSLATEAGEESEEQWRWFEAAIKHSKADGPIKSVSLKELVDMQPGWRKQVDFVTTAITKGGLPLFVAARGLRTTLTQLTLLAFHQNATQGDPRKRSFIPMYHGASAARAVHQPASIAVDLTSIYALHYLGLLGKVVETYSQVFLPAGSLEQMFEDRKRARFHQPSRAREAIAIRREVDARRLKVSSNLAPSIPELETEAGEEFSRLVSTAIRDRGVVVRPAPVHKIGSLGEEGAQLEQWKDSIVDVHEIALALSRKGLISEQEHNQALAYLSRHDRRWGAELRDVPNAPLLLDPLALNYLWTTRLLAQVCRGWSDVRISEDTFRHFTDLDQAIAESKEAVRRIDDLRRDLQRFIAKGSISISKRPRRQQEDDDVRGASTMALLAELPPVDAVVIDDRFVNQHATMTDAKGRAVSIVTTLSILDDLRAKERLDDAEWRSARHKLRSAGVGLISLREDELRYYIAAAAVVDGKVIESQELRAIRESLLAVAMVQPVDPGLESAFLAVSLASIRQAIASVWTAASQPQAASAKADWLNLLMSEPWELVREEVAVQARTLFKDILVVHSAQLCVVPTGVSNKKSYLDWVDQVLNDQAQVMGEDFRVRVAEQIKILIKGMASK